MTTNSDTPADLQPMQALDDLRVIELCDERGAWAGKLLADMGADVIKLEPPEGDATRNYEPFVDDVPDPEKSLYFWYYNTSKRSVVIDLATRQGQADFRRLVESADVVIDTDDKGELEELGLDYEDFAEDHPDLIWASITPFGRSSVRSEEIHTDLTLAANGGFSWMNGYDDHSLPPVRGGGPQAWHTGCHYAFMGILVALLERNQSEQGQFIDVNINASINVTTEAGSYVWLVGQDTVQRQTGRHAGVQPSMPSQLKCADGRYVNTGVPPRRPAEFGLVHDWLEAEGLLDEFVEAPLLLAGAALESFSLAEAMVDEEKQAIFGAGRDAFNLIASRIPAYEFFKKGQEFGFQVGIIHSPEEALEDPHFEARGMQHQVHHETIDRTIIYPGPPYQLSSGGWNITRRPPLLGEHTEEVLDALD